jgi:hypothetical protein
MFGIKVNLRHMEDLRQTYGQPVRNTLSHHIVDAQDFLTRWKPGPVVLAFLDNGKSDHQQGSEWLLIAPHVVPGGVIMAHDAYDTDWVRDSHPFLERAGAFAGWEEMEYPCTPNVHRIDWIPGIAPDKATQSVTWGYNVGWRTRAWRKTE